MIEHTFAIIKPDAVSAGHSGAILSLIEQNSFKVVRLNKGQIDEELARIFYAVHAERPFFQELVEFISSGPVIVMALEKENAIKEWRDLMGATNPAEATEGTVRQLFGTSIGNNAVHGSDASETATQELMLFFPDFANVEED